MTFFSIDIKMPYIDGKYYDFLFPNQKREYYRLYLRQYRLKNPEIVRNNRKRYYERHKEEVAKRKRDWLSKLSDEQRERIKESNRVYQWFRYNFDDDYRSRKLEKFKNKYHTDEAFRNDYLARYKKRYAEDSEFRERMKIYNAMYRKNVLTGLISVFTTTMMVVRTALTNNG